MPIDAKLLATAAVTAATTIALTRALPHLLKRAGAARRASSAAAEPPASARSVAVPRAAEDTLVQFVVVRRDLDWPTGSVIAQACHACVAIAWSSRDDAEMQVRQTSVPHLCAVSLG